MLGRLARVRFSIGELMAGLAILAVGLAWPFLLVMVIGVLLARVLRKAGLRSRDAPVTYTVLGLVFGVGGFLTMLAYPWLPPVYYADYRYVGSRLAALPGVTVVGSWKHEDVTLEDCGFTVKVRECPPVDLDFHDGSDWRGQFKRIDGVFLSRGSREIVPLSVGRLGELGIPARNLPELLANLERLMAIAGRSGPHRGRWPGGRRWVNLRL